MLAVELFAFDIRDSCSLDLEGLIVDGAFVEPEPSLLLTDAGSDIADIGRSLFAEVGVVGAGGRGSSFVSIYFCALDNARIRTSASVVKRLKQESHTRAPSGASLEIPKWRRLEEQF